MKPSSGLVVGRRASLVLALSLLCGGTLRAQAAPPASGQLEERVRTLVEQKFAPSIASGAPSEDRAPGGIVAVYVQGKRLFFPYGRIDEAGTPPSPNTVFGLASVTKVLTTAIFGQSPELFDAKVRDHAPEVFQLEGPLADITFGQLATYTAGISPSDPDTCKRGCDQAEFVEFINSRKPARLPAEVDYSNSSIGFLGQVLVAKSGAKNYDTPQAFQRWYEANLFKPLKMNATGVAPGKSDRKHPLSAAFDYDPRSKSYRVVDYGGWCPWGTAGRVFSTADDMLNFASAAAGASSVSGKPVPKKVRDGLQRALAPRTPMPKENGSEQGYAWIVKPEDAKNHSRMRTKNGGLAGISSAVLVNPDLQIAVVVLTNMVKVHSVEAGKAIMNGLENMVAEQPSESGPRARH
ncbi:MAG: serine hydrolase domain-containing protein [Myxococcales bacterium]